MWRQGVRAVRRSFRGFSTSVRRQLEDEGDWSFAPEWWEPESGGLTVFQQHSSHGNGLVSVVAHPSSRPALDQWPVIERWLQQRTLSKKNFTLSGLLVSEYDRLFADLKSLVSVGLATVASLGFDLQGAVSGKKAMRVLCIGHGGGSLPLFLASKFQGAIIHVVEIDPLVVSASIQAMGFPVCEIEDMSGDSFRLVDSPNQDLWQGIQGRLSLYISDAEDFILGNENLYDLVFIDAYDGDDIFPHKLWDPDGPFLKALGDRLHPDHGTVVVNLHADSDIFALDTVDSQFENVLPMGKYVSQVCRAYKRHLGLAYKVSVPWLCNISLVACRRGDQGIGLSGRNSLLNSLMAKSSLLEFVLDLPFPCVQYIKSGFALVD